MQKRCISFSFDSITEHNIHITQVTKYRQAHTHTYKEQHSLFISFLKWQKTNVKFACFHKINQIEKNQSRAEFIREYMKILFFFSILW